MKPVIQVLRDRESLAAIVSPWEELAAHALEPNPFYEPWILLPALRAQGEGEQFRCISIWDEGRLLGLFPFERRRRFKGLPVTTLTSWRHSAYLLCTPLVRADAAIACLRALVRQSRVWQDRTARGAPARAAADGRPGLRRPANRAALQPPRRGWLLCVQDGVRRGLCRALAGRARRGAEPARIPSAAERAVDGFLYRAG